MMHPKSTLPDLEERLQELRDGGLVQISRSEHERLFGLNDAALGRLRNFARGHQRCEFRRHASTVGPEGMFRHLLVAMRRRSERPAAFTQEGKSAGSTSIRSA